MLLVGSSVCSVVAAGTAMLGTVVRRAVTATILTTVTLTLGFAWSSQSNDIFSEKTISSDIELFTIGIADFFSEEIMQVKIGINKSLLLFLFFVLHVFEIWAQELTVKSFKLAESDISAQTQPRKDLNDRNCALVKVLYVGDIVDVEGNVVKPVVKRSNEFWIYMPQNSRQIKIVVKNYLPMMITFEDYGIAKLESNKTYLLTIVKPHNNNEPFDAGGNFYVLKVEPKNATVSIDDVMQVASSDGEYSAMLPYGEHSYKVEAGGYNSKKGTFTISNGEMKPIMVNLSSAMMPVNILCKEPGASIYVDKKVVAKGPVSWDGELPKGMHLVEIKKEGFRSYQTTMQIGEDGIKGYLINVDSLTAIQGSLSVNYKPFGSDVYVDGKKVGKSPCVLNGLQIGSHQVEISKEGYTADRKSVTISEAHVSSIEGTLVSKVSSMLDDKEHSSKTTENHQKIMAKIIKREASNLRKEGWTVLPGMMSIVSQLNKSLQYEDNLFPKYVMGEAMAEGDSYDGVKMHALELAKVNLVARIIQDEVRSLFQNAVAKGVLTQVQFDSIIQNLKTSKLLISQNIGTTITVLEVYRTLVNKNIEVLVRIACESYSVKEIIKKIIRSGLGNSDELLLKKIDEILDS